MSILLLLAIGSIPALLVHAFYAISLTASQRLGLLNAISERDLSDAIHKLEIFGATSFDLHLFRVLTFRSPWVIYPDSLSSEVKRVRT
jgi:hypothetical protein